MRVTWKAAVATAIASISLVTCASSPRGGARIAYSCERATEGASRLVALRIVDTQDAALPDVTVTLLNATGTALSSGVSDAQGKLLLPLPRSNEAYRVHARIPGFLDVEAKGVVVRDGCKPALHITMVVDMSQADCILMVEPAK